MSRYLLTFNKLDEMRFISHLDVQRLFKRALRRAGIVLLYSQGYNPHSKINLVQPLSLGFETICDYFEVETLKEQNVLSMISKLNDALPDGISFTAGKELPSTGKNLSSLVDFAVYKVFLPYTNIENAMLHLKNFTLQNEIMVNKRSKKTKQLEKKDVKTLVQTMEIVETGVDEVQLHLVLRSASNESLNPLYVLESFCVFSSEIFFKESCRITRQDLLFIKEGNLISLFEYNGI